MQNQPSKSHISEFLRQEMCRSVRLVPVLPVRDTVLFPHAVLPLTVGRESSIQLIESLGEERTIVVATQLDPRLDSPKPGDLHTVGTLATVHKVVRMPNQSRFVFTEGVEPRAAGALLADRAFHGGRGGDAGGHLAGFRLGL